MFGTQHYINLCSYGSAILGGLTGVIEYNPHSFIGSAQHHYILCNFGGKNVIATGNYISLCASDCSALMTLNGGGYANQYNTALFSNVYKASSTFRINHPDPEKNSNWYLRHSTVEAPSGGDTLYRYDFSTTNCFAEIELPDYFKHLNKNPQVWVTPNDGFGNAYGIIDETLTSIKVCSDIDGCFSALVMGTRKDKLALKFWPGVEGLRNNISIVDVNYNAS
jgi:hypothetical protein